MRYPNVVSIVCALPILWISSMWLSSVSMKTSLLFLSPFIFILVFRESSEFIVVTAYSAAPSTSNRSLCSAHPSITVFPWICSISPTLSGICEVLLVALCFNIKVVVLLMFFAWYLDICYLHFVSDVLPDCFLIESLGTSLTVEILPRPSLMSFMETHFNFI